MAISTAQTGYSVFPIAYWMICLGGVNEMEGPRVVPRTGDGVPTHTWLNVGQETMKDNT